MLKCRGISCPSRSSLLLAAAILANVVSQSVLNCSRLAIVDREYEIKGRITAALTYDEVSANAAMKNDWLEKLFQCRCVALLRIFRSFGLVHFRSQEAVPLTPQNAKNEISMMNNPMVQERKVGGGGIHEFEAEREKGD